MSLAQVEFVHKLRRAKLSLRAIEDGVEALRQGLGRNWFQRDRLAHDGRDLLIRLASDDPEWMRARDGQAGIPGVLELGLQSITFDRAGLPERVTLSQYEGADIVMDPLFAFGQPMVESRGVRVSDVAQLFFAGEPVEVVAEEFGVKRALENSNLDASDVIGKLIYYTLTLFVLQLAFGVFGSNPISDLLTSVISFLPSPIVATIIIVVASAIAAAVKTLVEGTLGGLSYGRALANAASIFVLFLGVVAALNQIGVATTVTTPLLIFILATVGGVIVVGAGGGLIRPMQTRWESYLSSAEAEAPRMREYTANAPTVSEQARLARDRAQATYPDDGGEPGSTWPTEPRHR